MTWRRKDTTKIDDTTLQPGVEPMTPMALLLASCLVMFAVTGVLLSVFDMMDWRVWLIGTILPLLIAAPLLLWSVVRSLLWNVEIYTGRDFTGDGMLGAPDEEVRYVYVRGSGKVLPGGVHEEDMKAFVNRICASGDWTQKTWKGRRLPQRGRCDEAYYNAMIAILEKAGFITGRTRGRKGELTTTDARAILHALGMTE